MRGRRKWAVVSGFAEVTNVFGAISQGQANLHNVGNILGYRRGFAAGTFVGMLLENRLALGNISIDVVSLEKGAEIAAKVRKAGYGATELSAEGHSGPVSLVGIVAPRKRKPVILTLISEIDPSAFVTVEDMRRVERGYGRLAK